jgi:hypothetical protein
MLNKIKLKNNKNDKIAALPTIPLLLEDGQRRGESGHDEQLASALARKKKKIIQRLDWIA